MDDLRRAATSCPTPRQLAIALSERAACRASSSLGEGQPVCSHHLRAVLEAECVDGLIVETTSA